MCSKNFPNSVGWLRRKLEALNLLRMDCEQLHGLDKKLKQSQPWSPEPEHEQLDNKQGKRKQKKKGEATD